MPAKNADLAAKVAELEARLALVEAAPIPGLAEARKRAEADKIWHAAKDIAAIVDQRERANALLAAAHEVKREALSQMPAATALDTLRQVPPGQMRADLAAMCSWSQQQEMLLLSLPAPRRVKLTLREDITSWSSSSIKGATAREDYPGVRLVSKTKATTEAGACERVYLESAYERMLGFDHELADAVRAGVVIAWDLDEQASRDLLRKEIEDLAPQQRPRIRW